MSRRRLHEEDSIRGHFCAAQEAHESLGLLREWGFGATLENDIAYYEGTAAGHLFRAAELAYDAGAARQ